MTDPYSKYANAVNLHIFAHTLSLPIRASALRSGVHGCLDAGRCATQRAPGATQRWGRLHAGGGRGGLGPRRLGVAVCAASAGAVGAGVSAPCRRARTLRACGRFLRWGTLGLTPRTAIRRR